MKMAGKPDAGVDKTLTKGLQLLEALSESDLPRGISEIATELALTKSNVHRLMQTLMKSGYVARDERTERYFLSPKLWRLARPQRLYAALRNLIHPNLEALAAETGESVAFVVVERDEIIMIDQIETRNAVRVFFSIGQALPVDEVVLRGKSLTAFQMLTLSTWSEDEARRVIAKIGRQLAKPQQFVDDRMDVLARIRADGFAMSEGEWHPGVRAVAAPVYDRFEKLLGIVLSFGPAERLGRQALAKARAKTCATAEGISALLTAS